jgi:predicted ArsR family transcriptional regulator
MAATLDIEIGGIALLDEPVRRALYLHVAGESEPVGRDAAAKAAKTTRENAAFHLDRLVDAGLLEASYKRLGERTGPGAGRPSKLYRRSARQLDVTLPARRYQLLAELLAAAIERAPGKDPRREIAKAARAFGERIGAEARASARGRGRAARMRAAVAVLDRQGFEPVEEPGGSIRLRNCPFDAIARTHRDLVCGMNLSFMEGVLEGLGASGVEATLDPQPGRCCVTLQPAG